MGQPQSVGRHDRLGSYSDPKSGTADSSNTKTNTSSRRKRGQKVRQVETQSFNVSSKKLEDQPYFHGRIPREEVGDILKNHGDFIVRETVNTKADQPIVMSVLWNQHQKHFPITHNIQKMKWHLGDQLFATVPELVLHYFKNRKGIGQDQVQLLNAVPKDKYQLSHDDVDLISRLGTGNFGEVWKAKLTREVGGTKSETLVAVKVCKDSEEVTQEEKKSFLMEARTMKRYHHENVLALIGICITKDPIMIVTELMTGGLDEYLKKNKGKTQATEMVKFCAHAASGMAYLSKKECIHRDLAARNCLLDDNKKLKISDFGLSRQGSQYTLNIKKSAPQGSGATGSDGPDVARVNIGAHQLPIRWLAPEALTHWNFTTKSDVWSFGVLMYEIFTEMAIPYAELANHEIQKAVTEDGVRLEPPPSMPERLALIMKYCLKDQPLDRPGFKELKDKITEEHNRLANPDDLIPPSITSTIAKSLPPEEKETKQ